MSKPANSKGIKHFPEKMADLESPCSTELEPRVCSITVGWGDCDPAQIAYTARIPAWVLSAIEDWYSYCLTTNWYEINLQKGIGTPFVSLSCEFRSPVTPGYPLQMHVYVSRLGNSSLSHYVEGYQNDLLCFTANTTAVFVSAVDMIPISIPPNMRSNIENYVQHQQRTFE